MGCGTYPAPGLPRDRRDTEPGETHAPDGRIGDPDRRREAERGCRGAVSRRLRERAGTRCPAGVTGARFSGARFSGTRFSGTHRSGTDFTADLSSAGADRTAAGCSAPHRATGCGRAGGSTRHDESCQPASALTGTPEPLP
jgi:hypothetical protein